MTDRRRYLAAVGATLTGGVAGCIALENRAFLADPDEGAAGVQERVDTASEHVTDGGATETDRAPIVTLPAGTYRWDRSLEVPGGVTVRAADDVAPTDIVFAVPDDHDLTAYPAPHDGEVMTAVTNASHADEPAGPETDAGELDLESDVHLSEYTIEFAGDSEPVPEDRFFAGIWLDGVTASSVERVFVHDVVPHARDRDERAYGVLVSNCLPPVAEDDGSPDVGDAVTVRTCLITRAGYEGIGVRGHNSHVLVADSETRACDTHGIQISTWTHGHLGRYYGYPRHVTVSDCRCEQTIIHHGRHHGEAAVGDGPEDHFDHDVRIERCESDQGIRLWERTSGTVVADCAGQLRAVARDDEWHEAVTVTGHTAATAETGTRDLPIECDARGDRARYDDVTIRETEVAADALLSVFESTGEFDDVTVGRVILADVVLTPPTGGDRASAIVRVRDGIVVDELRIRNVTAEVARIVDGVDGGRVRTLRSDGEIDIDAGDVEEVVIDSGA